MVTHRLSDVPHSSMEEHAGKPAGCRFESGCGNMNTPRDFRGQELSVDTYVAYNLSGEIAIGKIVSWREVPYPQNYPSYLRNESRFEFKIALDAGHHIPKKGHVSTVRSQWNLMALKELPKAFGADYQM